MLQAVTVTALLVTLACFAITLPLSIRNLCGTRRQ
jgi:hypothetical protein